MSVASKLTKSVRQAKESVANKDEVTASDAFDSQSPQQPKTVGKPAQEPGASKKPDEAPLKPFPYRRVWPD